MIHWTVDTHAIDAKIAQLGDKGEAMLRALEAFARVLKTRIQLGFRQGKGPSGVAWAPLKIRKGSPLRDTGNLRDSVVTKRDGDGVLVGTNLKLPNNPNSLGAVHQFGMTIKPKNKPRLVFAGPGGKGLIFAKSVTIPARPFMPLDAAGAVALPPAWEKSALASMAKALGVKP